jgi:uncharacterized membrane protein YeaQ/YmgE (transglycosylase-associated protein family)
MGILSWIVAGAIAGFLSRLVARGGGFRLLGDLFVGIAGGLVGGLATGWYLKLPDMVNIISPIGLLIAFLGGVLFIIVTRSVQSRGGWLHN